MKISIAILVIEFIHTCFIFLVFTNILFLPQCKVIIFLLIILHYIMRKNLISCVWHTPVYPNIHRVCFLFSLFSIFCTFISALCLYYCIYCSCMTNLFMIFFICTFICKKSNPNVKKRISQQKQNFLLTSQTACYLEAAETKQMCL